MSKKNKLMKETNERRHKEKAAKEKKWGPRLVCRKRYARGWGLGEKSNRRKIY